MAENRDNSVGVASKFENESGLQWMEGRQKGDYTQADLREVKAKMIHL